jgi:hypothetical protein
MIIPKFNASRIIDVPKPEDAGLGAPDVCAVLDNSSTIFYKRRNKYGGMDTSSNLHRSNSTLAIFYIYQTKSIASVF